ncbi:ribosomal protein L7/L12 [Enterovibrio paralichthyis]|uniref:ribosomal protein L7/L12 n=1 Tax=Enterovibrio paralichthyis TaxID=2853805 RepID=UPI002104D585|nr:ribosomal protein L7/L12 [Enterovibrio paralichthyis]
MEKNQLITAPKFDLVLTAVEGNKVDIIQAVKDATGLSLIESKGVVESAPVVLKENLSKSEAMALEKALAEAGATIEIKPVQ